MILSIGEGALPFLVTGEVFPPREKKKQQTLRVLRFCFFHTIGRLCLKSRHIVTLEKEGHYMLKMYDEGMLTKREPSRLSLLSA